MKEIFEINKEEIEQKADNYIKNLRYETTDEEKKHIKELYVASGLKQIQKMKRAHDIEYKKLLKRRKVAKMNRKNNLKRIRRGK